MAIKANVAKPKAKKPLAIGPEVTAEEIFIDFISVLDKTQNKDASAYQKYYVLKTAMKALETRMEELNEIIRLEMEKLKVDNQVFEYGTFTLVPRKIWNYTEEVSKLKGQLDFQKKNEELLGKASYTISNSLRFN